MVIFLNVYVFKINATLPKKIINLMGKFQENPFSKLGLILNKILSKKTN